MLNAKEMQKTITDMVRETFRGSRFEGIRIAPEDDDEDIERPSIKLTTDTKYAKEMLIKTSDTTADIFFTQRNRMTTSWTAWKCRNCWKTN